MGPKHEHLWPHASGSWGSWVTQRQWVQRKPPAPWLCTSAMPPAQAFVAPCQWQLGELGDPTKSWMTPHAIWGLVAPWPTQGMAGLTLGTQGAAQGIVTRQGQHWVPHEQRKAWLGSRWVLMAWGLTQGKVGCPRFSARHCQGKAECPRCSARGDYLFPPTVAH